MIRPLVFSLALLAATGSGLSAQEAAPLVKLTEVTEPSELGDRRFFGRVAARETVDLAFQVGGQIVDFPIIEGEPLEKSGLVAALDVEPFQLALDRARTQEEQAQRTVVRLRRLQGSAVSEVAVQDAQTAFELAAIAVRDAERALGKARLLSPFDAVVAERKVANFSTVSAGTPVARLHDMSELRIEIDVPEVLFQRASRETEFSVWATFPASDKRYPVETREFKAETSAVGQTFRITLGMAPPEDITVLPGSSATVTARRHDLEALPILPASAILTGNDGATAVLVFEPTGAAEGAVRRVPVEITPDSRGRVRIASGLEIGQEVVASGGAHLADGATVRRFAGFGR